jgi:hypothetical protein
MRKLTTIRDKQRKEFLFVNPEKAFCRECGASLHLHSYSIPLAEFLNTLAGFYEQHKDCDKKQSRPL